MVLALAGDSTMTRGLAPDRGRVPPEAPLPVLGVVGVSVWSVDGMAVGHRVNGGASRCQPHPLADRGGCLL